MIYAYASPAANLTAAALWILTEFSLFVYFQKKIPRRLEGVGLWVVRLAFWCLLTGLQMGQTVIPFSLNFVLRILLLILYTMTAGQTCLPLAFYVAIIFYVVKDICKIALLNVLCPVLNLPVTEDPWLNTCSMTVCALMQFSILVPLGRIIKMDEPLTLKQPDIIALLFPSVPYALIKYLQIIGFTYKKNHETETAVVCLMLCICDLIIFLQTEYRITTQQIRDEAQALLLRSQAQLARYRQEQEKIDEINKIYHDMKHHLNYIRSLSDSSKIREYIGSIVEDMEPWEMFSSTGSPVIDCVLARSGADCARLGIRLLPSVSGEIFEFMDPKDLLIIFGNALDNALEAVCRLERGAAPDTLPGTVCRPGHGPAGENDPQEILIRAGTRQNFAVLRVENHFSGQVSLDRNGLPRTTKNDGSAHGCGLKNIRTAAEKYGGEVTVHAEGGLFILTVMIPIKH